MCSSRFEFMRNDTANAPDIEGEAGMLDLSLRDHAWPNVGRPKLDMALLALIVTCLLPLSDARSQTLEEALVGAYLSNPTLEAQRAALRATDELVPQALSGWRPTIKAQSSAQTRHIDSSLNNGSLDGTSSALTLEQNLYQGGKTMANVGRAERLVRLERARLTATEQDVLLDAVEAYTDLLANLAVLELAKQNEGRLGRQLDATRDRLRVGEVTRTDVAQAEARLAGAVAQRISAEGTIQTSKATYRTIINQEPVALSPPATLQEIPSDEAEAQDRAQALNPDILAAEYNLAASRKDVRIAEAALLPRVDLQGKLSYDDDPNLAVDWQRQASMGLQLRVPLYQSGGDYAGIRQAKQTVSQRQSDVEAAIRQVREETIGSWQALATARSRIASIQEQVKAADLALEGSRQEAQVGQRTTLDVLDQENDLFQAGVDLVQAQRDEIVASFRLKAAVGELTAAELDLPVDRYDSEAYYKAVRNRLFGLGQ